jgi:hypothetical protein
VGRENEWYLAHRAAGGETDPVAEEVLAEVKALQAGDGKLNADP